MHYLRRTYHRLKNHFGHTRWNSKVTLIMWNFVLLCMKIVFVSMQDRCTVCAKHTIGSEIILDTPDGTPRWRVGVKMVWIFSDHIRDQIHLDEIRSVCIWVLIFNIQYHIRIQKIKSHIYDVDIQLYPIRHSWHYLYSNPNLDRNMKTNVISVISVRIRSVFIPTRRW